MSEREPFTKENAAEMGRKGGLRSAQKRREKKEMKDVLLDILNMPMKKNKVYDPEEVKNLAEMKGKNISVQTAIALSQVMKALKGDTKAAEFVRDSSGQRPREEVEMTTLEVPCFAEGAEDELQD